MVYILQLFRMPGVLISSWHIASNIRWLHVHNIKEVCMKRMGLWFGICAVVSSLIGLVIFSSHCNSKWPEQGQYEQHG